MYSPLVGPLAQLVEHLVCNEGVAGSNPVRSTTDYCFCTGIVLLYMYMHENFLSPSSNNKKREGRSNEYVANMQLGADIPSDPVREIMKKNARLFQSGALKENVVRDILDKEAKALEAVGLSKEESDYELQRVFNNLLPKS